MKLIGNREGVWWFSAVHFIALTTWGMKSWIGVLSQSQKLYDNDFVCYFQLILFCISKWLLSVCYIWYASENLYIFAMTTMFGKAVWMAGCCISHYAYILQIQTDTIWKKISFSIISLMPTLKLIILCDIKIVLVHFSPLICLQLPSIWMKTQYEYTLHSLHELYTAP